MLLAFKKEKPHYSVPPASASSSLYKSFFLINSKTRGCMNVHRMLVVYIKMFHANILLSSNSRTRIISVSQHDTFVKRLYMAKCLEDEWCNSIYWIGEEKAIYPYSLTQSFHNRFQGDTSRLALLQMEALNQ